MLRSKSPVWLLVLAVALFALPATAEVFHVTLVNGTTVDSSLQPQQASWDPNIVMLLTEVGNWVGFQKSEIADIKAVDPTAGFGVRISSTAIALGRFSNDLPESVKPNSPEDIIITQPKPSASPGATMPRRTVCRRRATVSSKAFPLRTGRNRALEITLWNDSSSSFIAE